MNGLSRAVFAIAVLIAMPADATHEADHRFIVQGTVRDDRGNPVADARVIVVDPRIDEGMTAFTDRNGDYEALLHLHNADLGDEIIVTALDQKKTIRAEFDPSDLVTVRKARVDFGAPGGRPSSSWHVSPGWIGVALLAAGFGVSVWLRRAYRRRQRNIRKSQMKK